MRYIDTFQYGYCDQNNIIKDRRYILNYRIPGCDPNKECDFCSDYSLCLYKAIEKYTT